jgi:rhodanese-related sulfurtransferase
MATTITSDDLKALLRESRELVILDVRRKADYEAEKQLIPGAVWRDPDQIDSWSTDIPRDREVVLYCVKGGSVSQSVTDRLRRQNVKASYVEGGLKAWRDSGGEVTP